MKVANANIENKTQTIRIFICGPPCSGKSTTAYVIQQALAKYGVAAEVKDDSNFGELATTKDFGEYSYAVPTQQKRIEEALGLRDVVVQTVATTAAPKRSLIDPMTKKCLTE